MEEKDLILICLYLKLSHEMLLFHQFFIIIACELKLILPKLINFNLCSFIMKSQPLHWVSSASEDNNFPEVGRQSSFKTLI